MNSTTKTTNDDHNFIVQLNAVRSSISSNDWKPHSPSVSQVSPLWPLNHFHFSPVDGKIHIYICKKIRKTLWKSFQIFVIFSTWSERTEWKYWVLNCCQVKVMNKATVTKEPKIKWNYKMTRIISMVFKFKIFRFLFILRSKSFAHCGIIIQCAIYAARRLRFGIAKLANGFQTSLETLKFRRNEAMRSYPNLCSINHTVWSKLYRLYSME